MFTGIGGIGISFLFHPISSLAFTLTCLIKIIYQLLTWDFVGMTAGQRAATKVAVSMSHPMDDIDIRLEHRGRPLSVIDYHG